MAVAFLINEDQEVLFLQKRPKDTFLAGFLVPIGGILKELKSMNQKEHV
jgi:8-oxo-dGTP diphosphatase